MLRESRNKNNYTLKYIVLCLTALKVLLTRYKCIIIYNRLIRTSASRVGNILTRIESS